VEVPNQFPEPERLWNILAKALETNCIIYKYLNKTFMKRTENSFERCYVSPECSVASFELEGNLLQTSIDNWGQDPAPLF